MFAVDHLAIWTKYRDVLVERICELTGLPALDGFQPDGQIVSRGVRFAGGPFLDIFQGDQPQTYLGLTGDLAKAAEIAAGRGWSVGQDPEPPADDIPPWTILYLARNGGALRRTFLIEYSQDQAAFTAPSYKGPLHKPWLAPAAGARLARVWLKVTDMDMAGVDLAALGYGDGGSYEGGRLWKGTTADIVVVPADGARESILRFDVEGATEDASEWFGESLWLHTQKGRS